MPTDDREASANGVGEVLRLVERAVAVARRRRRLRLGLVLTGVSLLGVLIVWLATLIAGG